MGDVAQLRPTAGQVPPHDLDAEAAVISAVLVDSTVLAVVQPVIRAQDFYSDANRKVWESIEAMDTAGTPLDEVTLSSSLVARGLMQQVGGTPYLSQLIDSTPSIGNAIHHAKAVAGRAHQRRLIATFKTLSAEGYGDIGDPVAWGQKAEQRVYEATRWERNEGDDGTLSELVPGVIQRLTEQDDNALHTGVPTGFAGIDKMLRRLGRGLVYVIGGRPGMGKSAFTCQLGTNIASFGYSVVEISLEMPRDQVVMRKLSQCAKVDFGKLKGKELDLAAWDRVLIQGERLRKIPLAVEYLVAPTVSLIRSCVRQARARIERVHGKRPLGLISIDYVQKMNGELRKGENREQEISRLSQEIGWLAGEFDCPVVLVAQLNRGPEQEADKRPRLKHLRDSGSLEQDAYAVLFPFRPNYYQQQNANEVDEKPEECTLIVAKHRNGRTGDVPMTFHGPSIAFGEDDPFADYADENRERYP